MTLEKCDESDEERWQDQEKYNNKDKDKDNENDKDKEKIMRNQGMPCLIGDGL